MNSITEALKNAGIKIPTTKRVWTWLKDHPSKTAKEVASGLNIKENIAYATLHNLLTRGMISAHKEYIYTSSKVVGKSYVNVYVAEGKSYELLPVKKSKPSQVKPLSQPSFNKPVVETKSKIVVDNLSVLEARELYEQLKKIFG